MPVACSPGGPTVKELEIEEKSSRVNRAWLSFDTVESALINQKRSEVARTERA